MLNPNQWGGALALYENAQRSARRAEGTIRLHRHYLTQLRERHRSPWKVTTEQLQEIMASRGWGVDALRSARSVYRGFYRWGHGMGYADQNPALILASIPEKPPSPRPAPEPMVWGLIDGPDTRISFMAELASLLALRAGEIACVHESDYVGTRRRGRLRVHGKGGKVAELPVLDQHLAARLFDVEGWAFPNGHGTHLSPGHVSRLLSQAMPIGWTGHKLRHRALSTSHEQTRDLLATMKFARHSKMDTTLAYVLMPDDALDAAVGATSRRSA